MRPTPPPVTKRVDALLPAQAAALQVPANDASAEVIAGLHQEVARLRADVDALMGLTKG